MAKFNFYLRDGKSKTETPIYLFISWDGNRLKYTTKVSVLPKLWNADDQCIIEKKGHPELIENNIRLSDLQTAAKRVIAKFKNDNGRTPSAKELKKAIDVEMQDETPAETNLNLLQYINKFIDESVHRTNEKTGKPIARGTINTYNQVKDLIQTYSSEKRKNIEFADVNLDFYFDLQKYMTGKGLATNTIGKRIAILKTILRDATERGVNRNNAYQSKRFKVTREKTDNIYLTESELMEIYRLDLSKNKKLDNVRDLFIIGCWTGLRFSDLSRLSYHHIVGDNIEIETQKTRESVSIPLHHIVKAIISKHDGKLPRALTNQKMNDYLKELGEKVESLHENTYKKITKGGLETNTRIEKYKRITTHTARRSFASNLFLDGVPSQTIMKITGHKTEKSFMQYIKITPQENANIIRLHWENKSKLSVLK